MSTELLLKKVDFLAAIAGKRIVDVVLSEKDSMGDPAAEGEVIIYALVLEDGTQIVLTASAQIGYDDVWASINKPA